MKVRFLKKLLRQILGTEQAMHNFVYNSNLNLNTPAEHFPLKSKKIISSFKIGHHTQCISKNDTARFGRFRST